MVLKEIREGTAGDRFRGQAYVQRVAIEPSFAREVLVHLAHHIVERLGVAGAVANQNVQQEAQDLSLGVIGDAEVRSVVVGVFLEPRSEERRVGKECRFRAWLWSESL